MVIGRDTVALGQALSRLRMLLIFECAAAIVASLSVLTWSVQRGLRPLRDIATENLLELARADAGQLEVASEAVDLVALLKNGWNQFSERAAERRLNVMWELPESCLIATDRTKLGLVLANILDKCGHVYRTRRAGEDYAE